MRSVIRHITRKSRGGLSVREEAASSEVLTAGRGPDCAIHLPDPRVLLHHAEFALRGGDLYVTALPNADLRINGNLSNGGKVVFTDVLHVGPYEIRREAPSAEGGETTENPSYHCPPCYSSD